MATFERHVTLERDRELNEWDVVAQFLVEAGAMATVVGAGAETMTELAVDRARKPQAAKAMPVPARHMVLAQQYHRRGNAIGEASPTIWWLSASLLSTGICQARELRSWSPWSFSVLRRHVWRS